MESSLGYGLTGSFTARRESRRGTGSEAGKEETEAS